jgi:hypothetical protein
MKHAIAFAVSAGFAATAVFTYAAFVREAADTAARQTLIALGDTVTMRAVLEGGDPADYLADAAATASNRAGEPVTGIAVDGATARVATDDGCWQVTVAGPFDPRPVTECEEVAS